MAAESLARRALWQRPGFACRRCRASGDPDRRVGDEFRRRRCHRSFVEARRNLRGWGGPNLIRSYEIERRQIGERNVGASRYATIGRRKWRPCGARTFATTRRRAKRHAETSSAVADVEQRKSNEMTGAELGYRYVDSPIICNVPGGPEHLFRDYQPTTWPGARLPHLWLDDGTPIRIACRMATRSSSSEVQRADTGHLKAQSVPMVRR